MIKILTATGGSKHAERAVRLSCRLAHAQAARLTALTVEDPDEATPLEDVRNRTKEVAQQYEATPTLVHSAGRPDQVIRNTAKEGYDLLVIGARGRHSMQDFFLGRNAIRLVKNLPVSTLIVRKNDTVKQILWRIPRGPIDEKHLALIIHIVNTLQAELTLFYVEPSAILFGHRRGANLTATGPCEPEGQLGSLRSRISEATGRTCACCVRTGIPEEVILDEAAIGNYDLVAVSARRRHGLGKLFTEDLSYRVARNIPVSVLLLN